MTEVKEVPTEGRADTSQSMTFEPFEERNNNDD